jgi:PPOX class probable F420-dependent enzyme
VPVCFARHDGAFWIAIDEKPKRTTALKRLRNIEENPRVSLLFDRYDEDWTRLGYVLVHGAASVIEVGGSRAEVLAALRSRYPQYVEMALEERPLVRVAVERVVAWGEI